MKYLFLVLVVFSACGVKEQADQLKALEKCSYEIVSADSVFVANTDIKNLIGNNGLNLFGAPQLAFAYFKQKIPLQAVLNLKITNPGDAEAAINEFEYKVFIKDTELLSGFINSKVVVSPNGGSTIIPVKVDRDIFPLISAPGNQQAIANFLTSKTEQFALVTFKIKPGLVIGNEVIKFPDFISIDKQVSNYTLLDYLKNKASTL